MITFYHHCKNWIRIYHIFQKNPLPLKTPPLFFYLDHPEWKSLTWPPKKHCKQFWWKSCLFAAHFFLKMIEQQLYSINRCQRQTSTAQMNGIVPGHVSTHFQPKKGVGGRVSRGENDIQISNFKSPQESFWEDYGIHILSKRTDSIMIVIMIVKIHIYLLSIM